MFAVNTQKRTSIKSSQDTGRDRGQLWQHLSLALTETVIFRASTQTTKKILQHAVISIFPEHQMGLQPIVFATSNPVFSPSLYPWQSLPRREKKKFADKQFVAKLIRPDVS